MLTAFPVVIILYVIITQSIRSHYARKANEKLMSRINKTKDNE